MSRLLLGLAVVAASACATARLPRVAGDPPPAAADSAKEDAYQAVLARYTRQQAVYDGLDTRLFVSATRQSPAFVESRVQRWADFRAIPGAEHQKALAEERARLSGATEFFLGVHANDWRFEDFEKPASMWRIALIDGGVEHAPVEIERLGRTTTDMRAFYSNMESFWVGYRVRFAVVPGGDMTLRLASSVGRAELKFPGD